MRKDILCYAVVHFYQIATEKRLRIFINKHFHSYKHLYFPVVPVLN